MSNVPFIYTKHEYLVLTAYNTSSLYALNRHISSYSRISSLQSSLYYYDNSISQAVVAASFFVLFTSSPRYVGVQYSLCAKYPSIITLSHATFANINYYYVGRGNARYCPYS